MGVENLRPGFNPDGSKAKNLTIKGTDKSDKLVGGYGHDTISGLAGDEDRAVRNAVRFVKLRHLRAVNCAELASGFADSVGAVCGGGLPPRNLMWMKSSWASRLR